MKNYEKKRQARERNDCININRAHEKKGKRDREKKRASAVSE